MVERLLKKQNMTKYRLAVEAGIPHATLNDICSGKTRLEKCSAETVYKLAKVLGVSMEMLTVAAIQNAERERAYEYGLPEYLQHDLDAYKEGLKTKSDLLDCLWGELYGSINIAEINDGAITREHAEFLLKFPPSGATKPTELSYTNSCISEHIASSIFNMVGIKAQETLLGTYEVSGKVKVVCACRDFTEKGYRLFDFCSIKNTILDSESGGSGTELADIMDTIEKQQYVEPSLLMQHFFNVFVVDALLGNFDRHNGNWGFLYDDSTKEARIAPVYDCGSCLLPQADERIMEQALVNEDVMNARVYQFPTSAIKLDGRKINYYDFLMSAEEPECNAAIQRMVPKINLEQIGFIEEVPFITELQKTFYKRYITARFEQILKPAYDMVMSEKQELSEPNMTM